MEIYLIALQIRIILVTFAIIIGSILVNLFVWATSTQTDFYEKETSKNLISFYFNSIGVELFFLFRTLLS